MGKLFIPLFITLSFFYSFQVYGGERFYDPVFDSVSVKLDIPFGEVFTQGGQRMQLTLDFYEPQEDTAKKRPLLVLAHGGYFLFGDKAEFTKEAVFLAEAGFTVASVNYRLIDVEDNDMAAKKAVIDAVYDMKLAIRFFYNDALTKNLFKVDTANIFLGGYSAGAVTALHYGYATTRADILEMGGLPLLSYVEEQNQRYGIDFLLPTHSHVKGVVNIAGSLHSAELIDANEPALFSIHGENDAVVPFESGVTGQTQVVTEGAKLLHQRAEAIGLTNELVAIPNEGHLIRYSCPVCFSKLRTFLARQVSPLKKIK